MTDDVERRRREDFRNRENRARLAFAYARYESDGTGTDQFEDAAEFGLTFIEEPFITTGHKINVDALAEAFGMDPEDEVPLPQVSSYVVEWDQDERGYYVGAWCAGYVSFAPGITYPTTAKVLVEHHFSFSAIAIKDVPIDADPEPAP